MSFRKIVINCHPVPGIEQLLGANRPNIPSAARDENIHGGNVMADSTCLNGKKPATPAAYWDFPLEIRFLHPRESVLELQNEKQTNPRIVIELTGRFGKVIAT